MMETTVKRIRKMLGLSQKEFADYLRTDRMRLSLAEIDKRRLPDEAWLGVVDLVLILESYHPEDDHALKPISAVSQPSADQIRRWYLELRKFEWALNKLQKENEQLAENRIRLQRVLEGEDLSAEQRTFLETCHAGLEFRAESENGYQTELELSKKILSLRAWLEAWG